MRKNRLLVTLLASGLVATAFIVVGGGCSSTDPRPGAGSFGSGDGSFDGKLGDGSNDRSTPVFDASFDAPETGTINCTNTFDPNKVYLHGTTTEATSDDIISTLSPPYEVCIYAKGTNGNGPSVIRGDKKFMYTPTKSSALYLFAPDTLVYDMGKWTLPPSPETNDTLLPTPKCSGDLNTGYAYPDVPGDYAYKCLLGGAFASDGGPIGTPIFDGGPPGTGLFALGYTGHVLRTSPDFGGGGDVGFFIEDSAGNRVRFNDPALLNNTGQTVRAQPDGFWYVVFGKSGAPDQLWKLGFDGNTTVVGTYSPTPPSTGVSAGIAKLDSTGAMYQLGTGPDPLIDIVIKRPLAPGASSIVYDESKGPAGSNDFTKTTPPILYAKIHNSNLVTGP